MKQITFMITIALFFQAQVSLAESRNLVEALLKSGVSAQKISANSAQIEICDFIEKYHKQKECLTNLAVENLDLGFCLAIDGDEADCFNAMAAEMNDPKVCLMDKNSISAGQCFYRFIQVSRNPSECNIFENLKDYDVIHRVRLKAECLGIAKSDVKECDKLKGIEAYREDFRMNNCITTVSDTFTKSSDCHQIKFEYYKNKCLLRTSSYVDSNSKKIYKSSELYEQYYRDFIKNKKQVAYRRYRSSAELIYFAKKENDETQCERDDLCLLTMRVFLNKISICENLTKEMGVSYFCKNLDPNKKLKVPTLNDTKITKNNISETTQSLLVLVRTEDSPKKIQDILKKRSIFSPRVNFSETELLNEAIGNQSYLSAAYLLELGADPKKQNQGGSDSMELLLTNGCVKVIAGRFRNSEGPIKHLVRKLIKSGILIERKNANGETPLFTAIKNSCIPAAEALITLGANLDVKNKDGKLLSDLVIESENQRLSKFFNLHRTL